MFKRLVLAFMAIVMASGPALAQRATITQPPLAAAATAVVHPGYIANRWYAPVMGVIPSAGTSSQDNLIVFKPLIIYAPGTIDQIAVNVTTADAAGLAREAIYASDPTTKMPINGPIATVGEWSLATTGVIPLTLASNVSPPPGFYWTAHWQNSATAIILGTSIAPAISTILYGASTAANGMFNTTNNGAIAFRVSATYGSATAWPVFTTGSTFTQVVGASAATGPLTHLHFVSVP